MLVPRPKWRQYAHTTVNIHINRNYNPGGNCDEDGLATHSCTNPYPGAHSSTNRSASHRLSPWARGDSRLVDRHPHR